MAKPTPSRMVALAVLAAIAIGFAAPASAMSYGRPGAERDLVFVPVDSDCTSYRAGCDMARYN